MLTVDELKPIALRALRDMATGHLAIWRTAAGEDHPDRQVGGNAVRRLHQAGLIAPPPTHGQWALTALGREVAADKGWL